MYHDIYNVILHADYEDVPSHGPPLNPFLTGSSITSQATEGRPAFPPGSKPRWYGDDCYTWCDTLRNQKVH